VREDLNINQKDFPIINAENLKDSDVVTISVESANPDQDKKILETINGLIVNEHEQKLANHTKELQDNIDIQKRILKESKIKITSLEAEQQALEDKIAAIKKISTGNFDINVQFIFWQIPRKNWKKEAGSGRFTDGSQRQRGNNSGIGI